MSLEIYGFDFISARGAYLVSIILLTFWLYFYIFYLYRAKSRGMDYEKYSNLALKDSLEDEIIESVTMDKMDRKNKGDNNELVK